MGSGCARTPRFPTTFVATINCDKEGTIRLFFDNLYHVLVTAAVAFVKLTARHRMQVKYRESSAPQLHQSCIEV